MRSRSISLVWLAPLLLAACLKLPQIDEQPAQPRQTDDDAGTPSIDLDAGGPVDAAYELPPADPHALLGVDPPHGPFSGGQQRTVRGNGFTSHVRVWFGAAEVPADQVTPIDPHRAQVLVPPGAPGAADVTVQDADDTSTRRTLPGAYTYDAFYADPSSGPTSGGTIVHLVGQGTQWDASSVVTIGSAPCTAQNVSGPADITCTVPKATAGARSVTVTTGGVPVTVLDAFTYADSDNGFKGGLSGNALDTALKVLVYDNGTGDPIVGATVIAGDDLTTGVVTTADASGVALITGVLGPARTVTIAARCHQPTTFVGVTVDTVTAYLDPVMSPDCQSGGDPSSVGGSGGEQATVTGQLVWTGSVELKRAPWTNVPAPASPDEQQAAYVLTTSADPTQPFRLPDPAFAVHPDSAGDVGYAFSLQQWGGNLALYALAGIENRAVTPPTFVAYALGVVQGVAASAGQTTSDVMIPMDVTLDQAVTFELAAPTPGPRGPDRVTTSLAVGVGNDGWILLPNMQRTTLAPATQPILLGGAPALGGPLASATYVATAKAGSGPTLDAPLSVLGRRNFTDASQPVALDAFVPVPVTTTPAASGAWSGTAVQLTLDAAGSPPDLLVLDVKSAGGLVTWTIAAPATTRTFALPDLAAAGSGLSLVPGPISVEVHAARIPSFDWGNLRYRQLQARGWTDWSMDVVAATYAP